MNIGEMRMLFIATLNNDECTDTLADMFISQGIRRVERILRTPMQKDLAEFTIPEDFDGSFTLPYDYLGLDWIKVNGVSVQRTSPTLASRMPTSGEGTDGYRRFWVENENVYFSPTLTPGDVIKFNYYRELDRGDEDLDNVEYSEVVPDLILYSSLIFAGVYFLDDRKSEFKELFMTLLAEVQTQADLDELSGGAFISNPYEGYI